MGQNRGLSTAACLTGVVVLLFASACGPSATSGPPITAATPTVVLPPAASPSPTRVVTAATPTPAATPVATPASQPEKPQYGGQLALTLNADPPSLDFNGENTVNVWEPGRAAYESLVRRDAWKSNIPIEGHLAESWDLSRDGTALTFKLRQGIKWQDGSPFTAEDVRFTFERYANPPRGVVSVWRAQLRSIKETQALDDTTARVVLSQPTASLLDSLTYIVVYSKKWIEGGADTKRSMLGTGPFRFTSLTPAVNWQFAKNPNYWQQGKPYLDGLTWHIISDGATRFAALRTGRIRVASSRFSQISPSQKEQIERDKLPVRMWPTFVQGSPYMLFNLKQQPFNDVRVRQAIHLATDRAQARKVLFENAGRPGFWFTYSRPPGIPFEELMKSPGFRENPEEKQQDIQAAKGLLAEAGYPNGFKAVITSRPLGDFRNQAVFMTNELGKLGIQATVEVLEDATVFAKLGRGDFQMGQLQGTTNLRPDPSDNASLWFLPTSGLNYSRFDDAEFLRLYDEQSTIADPTARSAIVRKMEQRLIDVMPGIHVGFFHGYLMAWNDIRNWPEYDRGVDSNVLPNVWVALK